jgi:hypothetical protein
MHGYEYDDDALAYGDYYPRRRGVWEDRLADDIVDICQGLRDMLAFPSIEPFRHQSTPYKECRLQDFLVPVLSMGKGQHMSLSGTYCETDSIEPWVLYKPSIRPRRLSREHHHLRPSDIEEMHLPNLDSCTAARPSLPRSHLSMSLGQLCRLRQNPQKHLHTTRLCPLANRSSRLFSAAAGPVTQTSLAAAMSILVTGLYHAPLGRFLGR